MKITKIVCGILAISVLNMGCKSWSRTQKGAAVGTAGGGVIGAVVGRAAGNTALGAIIGAAVGGVTGAIIGKKMDKQAEEIKKTVPGAKVYRVGEGIIVEFNDKILFGFDKSDLNESAGPNLNKLVLVLNNNPDTDIEIQGHTDNVGTDEYNMALSKRRATSAANHLKQNGISSRRTSIKGFGESAPNYTNETDEGRSQNRRVEFLITANAKMRAEAKKEAGK